MSITKKQLKNSTVATKEEKSSSGKVRNQEPNNKGKTTKSKGKKDKSHGVTSKEGSSL